MATLFEMLQQKQGSQPQYGGNAALADSADAIQAMPQQPLMRPTTQRQQSRGPGLLDTIWGVAAGYSPNATRQMHGQREQAQAMREQQMAERERTLASITDPRERAAFMANPQEWGKAQAGRFGVHNLGRGAQLVGGGGETVANNPYQFQSGDQIVEVGAGGARPIYTRTAPSIAETLDRDRLALGDRQFGVTSGIAQQNANTNQAVGLGGLALNQAKSAQEQAAIERTRGGQIGQAQQTAAAMTTALGSARRFANAAGVISQYNPLKMQDRANLEGYLSTLKGNITLGKLAEMKANSPQGASGMGALSDTEGNRLANAVAALDIGMSPSELQKSFDEIQGYIDKLNTPTPAPTGQPVRVTSIAQARALPSGTEFIDPNGVRRRVP